MKKAAATPEKPDGRPPPQKLSAAPFGPPGNAGSGSKAKAGKVPALDLTNVEAKQNRGRRIYEQWSSRRDADLIGGSKSARRYDPEAEEEDVGAEPVALQKAWATSRPGINSHSNTQYRKLRLDCNLESRENNNSVFI